jgi:hypothetical protein
LGERVHGAFHQIHPGAVRIWKIELELDGGTQAGLATGRAEAHVALMLLEKSRTLTERKNGPNNPHFPAHRSGHQLFQRPSPEKQIPWCQPKP